MAENSTPPKERINITYKSKTNGQSPEVELPLKLMVMAKSLENDSSSSPADEEKPSENGASDIDLDALAKMAEAL